MQYHPESAPELSVAKLSGIAEAEAAMELFSDNIKRKRDRLVGMGRKAGVRAVHGCACMGVRALVCVRSLV